jgi:hypothetical protein
MDPTGWNSATLSPRVMASATDLRRTRQITHSIGDVVMKTGDVPAADFHVASKESLGYYEPLAAMIKPLRWVPDMSPRLGALPKVKTLPSASEIQ